MPILVSHNIHFMLLPEHINQEDLNYFTRSNEMLFSLYMWKKILWYLLINSLLYINSSNPNNDLI